MTTFLSDSFTGSGALTAHTPDAGQAGVVWEQLGAYNPVELSGGALVVPLTVPAGGAVPVRYGNNRVNRGFEADCVFSISITSPASLAVDAYTGFGVTFGGNGVAVAIYATAPGAWQLDVDTEDDAASIDVTALMAASATYPATITVSGGIGTLEMFGLTVALECQPSNSTGLNSVLLKVSDQFQTNSVEVTGTLKAAPSSYLAETFTGTGSGVGHSPDASLITGPWEADAYGSVPQLVGGLLMGDGGAAGWCGIKLGDGVSDYGLGRDLSSAFALVTGASLANGYAMKIGVRSSGKDFTVTLDRRPAWTLVLESALRTQSADVSAALAASSTYAGVLTVHSSGLVALEMLGQTLSIFDSTANPVGLNQVRAAVGDGYGITGLSIEGNAVTVANTGLVQAPSPLRDAQALALHAFISLVQAPSPLHGAHALAQHDFTGVLGDAMSVYVMDLITPAGPVRAPISSWQATLQTGASNYVQCVVPACAAWFAALNTATEFVIYRRAVLPSGAAIEYEMARAPASTVQYDQGPERYTCTLSGYSPAFAASATPNPGQDRTLTGVRSVSIGRAMRVRCAVDWLLRPGQRALVHGVPMPVRYINYYAPSGFDSYMDVGEEA